MSHDEKPQSRRSFLKTVGAVGAGSLLAGAGQSLGAASPALAAGGRVPRRPFGKTGVEVATLSLGGTMDMRTNQLLMAQSLKLGVNYWDTAESYRGGHSESGMGKFLGKHPEVRKDIFLVSKTNSFKPKGMSRALDQSLERLQTDYVDLYFLHMVSDIADLDRPEIKRWAQQAKASGKIKLFGFSTHRNMEQVLYQAAPLGWIDGIMMTYNYRIMHTESMDRAVEACYQAGIGLTAMKTQGGGPVADDSEGEVQLAGRFLKKGYTPYQAKLKAVWQDKRIAAICSKMPNTTVLMANAAAAMDRTSLSQGDLDGLARYAQATCGAYCAGCAGICEDALDGAAPIAEVMRSLMYLRAHGEPERARRTLARALPTDPSRLLELDYTEAQRRCPQGLDIAGLMHQALAELA
jgi:uncharacterized protein